MYLDRAKDEDKKMVEGWKDDAEGLLVFVGPCTTSYSFSHNLESVDWFILGCRCSIARSNPPRYSAEFAGRLNLLLGTNLSATGFPIEWIQNFHPVESVRSLPAIHPPYSSRMGQRALVPEPGYQSYLRPIGNVATAVGASLSNCCPPTVPAPQASTYSCILCARRRKLARSVDGRSVTNVTPYLPFSLLRRPLRVLVRCQSHHLQRRDRVGRSMRRCVRIPHVLAYYAQEQPLLHTAFCFGLFLSHRHAISPLQTF
jgi:hypothetical protein